MWGGRCRRTFRVHLESQWGDSEREIVLKLTLSTQTFGRRSIYVGFDTILLLGCLIKSTMKFFLFYQTVVLLDTCKKRMKQFRWAVCAQ